jgi:hypothetical protein
MTIKTVTDVQHQAAVSGRTALDGIPSKTPYSSIAARPRLATSGQRVTITGNAPRNARPGQWVTLKSHAFSSRFTSNGIASVRAQVLVDGTFRVTATLRQGLAPTTYTVRGSYKGQPLDTVARISVRDSRH